VTWSRILAPRGWPLQGLGVVPQVCTSLGPDEVKREEALLAEGQAPLPAPVERERAARAPVSNAEALEIRNACPPAEGREGDMDVAKFLISNPVAYAAALLSPMAAGAR
jgi:carboxyl-terminal processing protease